MRLFVRRGAWKVAGGIRGGPVKMAAYLNLFRRRAFFPLQFLCPNRADVRKSVQKRGQLFFVGQTLYVK